jgi:hypothetical protein
MLFFAACINWPVRPALEFWLMKILRTGFSIVVFVLLTSVPSQAQEANSGVLSNPGLANARALIRENQEATLRSELRLTEVEGSVFWPLYEEYRADLDPIQDRYVALVAGYLQKYQSGVLTEEYAESLLDDYFDIKGDLLKVRKRYVRRFKRDLPMLKVARFYQLENKMIADIDAELALIVPLVESN